jgi:hypothetical protein
MPPIRWPFPGTYPRGPVRNAPPYPDLRAVQFRIQLNHENRYILVSGVVSNDGNSVVTQPFRVALGVTIDWPPPGPLEGPVRSQQAIVTIQPPLAPGVQIETSTTSAPLVYYDEEGAIYWLDMIVDVNNEVAEYGSATNSLTNEKWFAYSPATLAKGDSFQIGDIAAELEKAASKRG